MKRIIYLYFILSCALLLSCSKNDSVEMSSQQKYAENEYSYSEELVVFDETTEKSIVLKISSDYIDSLNSFIGSSKLILILNKNNANNQKNELTNSSLNTPAGYIPSVIVDVVNSNGIVDFAIQISRNNLKSTNAWMPIPIAAYTTANDFIGAKNTGADDFGARFSLKSGWLSSFHDVADPNIIALRTSEKFYVEESCYRLRLSVYAKNGESPQYIIFYSRSSYEQF